MLRIPARQAPYDNVNVVLTHPGIRDGDGNIDKLVITTGADQINWSYNLNTRKFQTYGGEVIQILSANVGELTIEGTVRDYTELDRIYDWFKKYIFNLRGANIHNPETIGARTSSGQQPVHISYPHRGWEWDVYIREAPGYRLGRDVVAPQWRIVCEFFHSEDKQKLESEFKNSFTDSLTNGIAPSYILTSLRRVYSDPLPLPTGGDIETVDPAEIANTMGDHFQRLIAAWGFGDFARFAYDSAGFDESVAGLDKSADEYFKEVYGTDVLQLGTVAGGSAGGGSTGGFTGQWPGAGASLDQKALYLGALARQAGVEPTIPVMAALVETGGTLNNELTPRDSHADSAGLFQIRVNTHTNPEAYGIPITNAQYAALSEQDKAIKCWCVPEYAMKWFVKRQQDTGSGRNAYAAPNKNYASLPESAANWGQWCQAIEGSQYPDRYQERYTQAKELLEGLDSYISGSGASGGDVQGTTRQKIVYWAEWAVANKDKIEYGQGNQRFPKPRSGQAATGDLQDKPPGTLPFSTDCSAFVGLIYKWAGAPLPPGGFLCATGSMQGAPARRINMSEALPGDYIIYGSGSGDHAVVVVEAGANPAVISHGNDAGPVRTVANYRSGAQAWRSLPDGTT